MAVAGEDHADAKLVAAVDGLLVADGAARLYDGGDTGFVGQFHAVVEGEEGVGSQHGTVKVKPEGMGLLDGLAQGIDARGLANA